MNNMKKIILITLSLTFIVGITSCGKTTKRKLVNDWRVTSSLEETEYTSNGDHSTNTTTIAENEVTTSTVYDPSTGPTTTNSATGSVLINEFIIQKDGTWSLVREISFQGGTSSSNNRMEQSGTWSFLKNNKSDDFKKNERVHFNVLKSKSLETVSLSGSVVNSNSYEETYLTGEKVLVYTIKESKKDQLEMEMETSSSLTQTSGNNYSNSAIKRMTLESK
jgi:hypothetical protein